MQRTISGKILSLILAFAMLMSTSACNPGDPEDISSTDVSQQSEESEAEISGSETEESEAQTSGSEAGSSVSGTESEETSSSEANSNSTQGSSAPTAAPTAVPTLGPATSLTRDQVMAKMPAKLRGTTINYFVYTDPKNTNQKDVVEAFEEATGITLQVEIANKQQYNTQLAAKISSGSSPDMVIRITNDIDSVFNLQPITNSGFDFNDTAWDKDLMKDFTFNGRIYAANLENSPSHNIAVILYNKRALRKAEMEDPYEMWKNDPNEWTWDKLWSMCDTFLKANRNREGFYGITFNVDDGYPRSFGAGFYRYDPTAGKYINLMKSTETRKRYEILIDAMEKSYVSRTSDASAFTMGYILFAFSFSSAISKSGVAAYSTLGNDLGSVPVPTDSTYMPLFEYCAYGIPVGAKNAEAVPYYLRYVMDRQSYDVNDLYLNEQSADIIEYSLSRGNYYLGFGSRWAVFNALTKGTSAQVKSTLDSYYGEIEDLCLVANERIKNMSK